MSSCLTTCDFCTIEIDCVIHLHELCVLKLSAFSVDLSWETICMRSLIWVLQCYSSVFSVTFIYYYDLVSLKTFPLNSKVICQILNSSLTIQYFLWCYLNHSWRFPNQCSTLSVLFCSFLILLVSVTALTFAITIATYFMQSFWILPLP